MSQLEKAARAAGAAGVVTLSDEDWMAIARAVIASIEPDDAMVEAVARALCAHHFNMCGNDDEDEERVVSRRWNMFVPQARAALKAGLRALLAEGEKG